MSNKNMQFFMFIIVLPIMTHGMLVTRIQPLLRTTKQQTMRRPYNTGAACELRKLIDTPNYTTADTQNVIQKTLPKDPKPCDVNGLIEDIIFKATQYKQHEKHEILYVNVLRQLHLHGWSISSCCIYTQLHEAAKSDLCRIALELLHQKEELVNSTDLDGRIPLHHAQSKEMAKLLIQYKSPVDAKDKQKNTPLHCVPFSVVPLLLSHGADIHAENDIYIRTLEDGWQHMTPLRKAAYEGDVEKCAALIASHNIDSKERELIQSIAELNYWRTRNTKFFIIYEMLVLYEMRKIIDHAITEKE